MLGTDLCSQKSCTGEPGGGRAVPPVAAGGELPGPGQEARHQGWTPWEGCAHRKAVCGGLGCQVTLPNRSQGLGSATRLSWDGGRGVENFLARAGWFQRSYETRVYGSCEAKPQEGAFLQLAWGFAMMFWFFYFKLMSFEMTFE